MKAIWNNEVIAESNETVVIEGNHYFPHDSIKKEYLIIIKGSGHLSALKSGHEYLLIR